MFKIRQPSIAIEPYMENQIVLWFLIFLQNKRKEIHRGNSTDSYTDLIFYTMLWLLLTLKCGYFELRRSGVMNILTSLYSDQIFCRNNYVCSRSNWRLRMIKPYEQLKTVDWISLSICYGNSNRQSQVLDIWYTVVSSWFSVMRIRTLNFIGV